MKSKSKYLILLSLCLLLSSNCHKTTENPNNDILPLLIKTPDQLEFLECKEGSGQIVLEAKYRVSGTDAQLIEDLLHKEYGMSLLKFICCGWEAHPDGTIKITDKFNDKYRKLYDYNHISISMYSGETQIQDRTHWHEIPYFYVIIKVISV